MTPDLSYDQEGEKRRAKIINGMGKKQEAIAQTEQTELMSELYTPGY